MESLKRSLKYQFIESKKFLLKFWITMIILNIVFYVLNYIESAHLSIGFSLGSSEETMAISVAGINLMAIFITLIAHSYDRSYQGFPLARSLSMTRKDYFISLLTNNIMIVFISAIIQSVLLTIDPIIMGKTGKEPLYNFINFNLKTDNIFFIIFSLFMLFMIFISASNLLSSLNYKFGYKLWIAILGFNILVSIFNIKAIEKSLIWIGNTIAGRYGLYETLIILVGLVTINILSYFVIINSDIKKRIV